ncbi:MAG: EamA/RhaT family transporter, partial [Acetobacteraceae bacterium]
MLIAHAMLAASMILVGANVPIAKLLAEALPIPLIAFLRCVLATLVLWPLVRVVEGRLAIPPREILRNLFW